MPELSHMEGFEKEDIMQRVFAEARSECKELMWDTFKKVVYAVAPGQYEETFKRRKCERRLLYTGIEGQPPSEEYVVGTVYESEDFTGATYTIKGHSVIGCAHFVRVE